MIKTRIIILVAIVIAAAILYMLPGSVVDNSKDNLSEVNSGRNTSSAMPEVTEQTSHAHHAEIPDSLVASFKDLRNKYKGSANQEKKIIFADSLAEAFRKINFYDSSAVYSAFIAKEDPSEKNTRIAGDDYYQAFNRALDNASKQKYGEIARDYYQQVLESNPGDLDLKVKIGVTYVTTSSPMQGIQMIRQVLEKDPENRLAIYNLGVLSITSGQYDKAVERFKKLISMDPNDGEAHFYLGLCYQQLGNKDQAKQAFEEAQALNTSSELKAAAGQYLKALN